MVKGEIMKFNNYKDEIFRLEKELKELEYKKKQLERNLQLF